MNSDSGENQTNTASSEETVDYKLISELIMGLGLQIKGSYIDNIGPEIIADMLLDLGISIRNGSFFEAYAMTLKAINSSKEEEDQLKKFFDDVKDVH